MTVLHALNGYYDRLAARGDVPGFGFSVEKISFAIVLSPEGEVIDVVSVQDTSSRKPRPCEMEVPAARKAKKRASKIDSNLLWDKTSYALGVANEKKKMNRVAQEHTAFLELHASQLEKGNDEGLTALARFLDRWTPERFDAPPFREEMLDTNVVFRLDGEKRFLHERPAARDLVARRVAELATDGTEARCLITGERGPIARLHPPVKGVRGAQSSGASIVSFNLDAFASHGKEQGLNAPISEQAAFAYTTALNKLLARDSRQKVLIGDTTTVFWAEARDVDEEAASAAENFFADVLSPPSDEEAAANVRDALERIADGRALEETRGDIVPETPFHILGLAPNASRLSIRFSYRGTIGVLSQRVGEHWRDLDIEPSPWQSPPAAWQLLYETAAQRKAENIPPLLGGALMRAILTGGRYPQALFAAIIMRVRDQSPNDKRRKERSPNGKQAAILRACLTRDYRLGFQQEDIPVSLDLTETNPAYRLGRLFAVLEGAQNSALGNINATIRDRYFGAASAAPASTFPALIRNAKNHLKVIRTQRGGGLASWYDKEIGQIVDGLEATELPRSLSMADQGRFSIGYYHERASLYRSRRVDDSTEADDGSVGNEDPDSGQEE